MNLLLYPCCQLTLVSFGSARSTTPCRVILKFITFCTLVVFVFVPVCTITSGLVYTSPNITMYYTPTDIVGRYIAALSNMGRKSIRIQHQYQYLLKSKKQETVPRGIHEQCIFKCSVNDHHLQSLLTNMMAFTAGRILDTLIMYYHNWSTRLRENYYKLANEFKNRTTSEDYNRGMIIVNQKLAQQRVECEKNHFSKLERDNLFSPKSYIPNNYSHPHQHSTTTEALITLTEGRQRRRKKKSVKARSRKRLPVHKHRRQKIKSNALNKNTVSQEELDKTVINLSSRTITNAHKFVFYLGESFAVTPSKTDRDKLLEDVNSWANKLRMGFILSRVVKPTNSEQIEEVTMNNRLKQMEKDLKIRPPSKKNYSNSGNHALELFISNVKKQIANHKGKTTIPKNVDKETLKAIKDLSSWDDTVIRLFDKGTGFFVLDKAEYINRVEAALKDQNTFKKVETPQVRIKETIDKIKAWAVNYTSKSDCPGMTLNFIEWITPTIEDNEPGVNYMNFKAHKPEKNYPGRLISTGCNSYIKNLSIFTAEELKKVDLPHCLKDSNELLNKINQLNESSTLSGKRIYHVTFDVVNMFPSISKEIGLPACRDHLEKRQVKLFSTDCVMEALEITLDNNLTVFNGNMYVQVSGTAMGPNNACQYADTALSPLDREIYNCQDIVKPEFYGRFRDDIYVAWSDTLEKLDEFLTWLNGYHPNLKFTMSTPSLEGTEFLDLFIYSKNDRIETTTYSKPSDAHSYLLPQSCHPTHVAENIPYGVANRVFKNCSEDSEYNKSKVEFSKYLEDRNYSNVAIEKAFQKVEKLDRNAIIAKDVSSIKSDTNEKCFPLVCDFNPGLPPVGKILNRNKFILNLDPALKKDVKPNNVFVSYRGNKTIKDTLVPSRLSNDRSIDFFGDTNTSDNVVEHSSTIEEGGCFPCVSKCKACRLFICESKTAKSFHTDYTVNILGRIDCNTVGVCYLVNDKVCRRSSVGSTINNFKSRWQNHKSHIRKSVRSCEIATHFNSEFHDLVKEPLKTFDCQLSNQIEVVIFEKLDFSRCQNQDDKVRVAKERETFWQNQLMTLDCYGGLNKRTATNEIRN